jgi:hypothetical protein
MPQICPTNQVPNQYKKGWGIMKPIMYLQLVPSVELKQNTQDKHMKVVKNLRVGKLIADKGDPDGRDIQTRLAD